MNRQHYLSPLRLCQLLIAFLISALAMAAHADSAPGGFLQNDDAPTAHAALDAAQIQAFLPSRGGFTFPAPYGTHGIRITNASDCGGQDCVDMPYSYWRNMSNSAGSDTIYIFVGLDKSRGGAGPTLFKYSKSADKLTKVGPLFASSSPFSRLTAEGWYFSYGMPTKIYLKQDSKLLRYDVLTHAFQTVFDSLTKYPNTVITQTNSSNDDDVHSATLENASTYAKEGCLVYKASTKKFTLFPVQGKFDECQIDKSGRYLVIKEKLPSDSCASCDEDDVIVDLATGNQHVIMDQNGAGGHSDLGYGWMVASDNWNTQPNAWRLWNLADAGSKGDLVYHGGTWGVFSPSHVSFANAVASQPVSQQYVCGGAATADPSSNDIVCFTLDASVPAASQQAMVIAPAMSSLNATGGDATCPSCQDYGKDPKGNLDPTGQYFFWVSNAGGSRMDAFMVHVPQKLNGGDSTVVITSPKNGADVNGALVVTASVPSGMQVAMVTFKVDGGSDTSATDAPYQASWPAGSLSAGRHTLTAVASDVNGNTSTSAPVEIVVGGSAGGTGSSVGKAAGGGGGGGAFGLVGLLVMGFFGVARKLARSNHKGV